MQFLFEKFTKYAAVTAITLSSICGYSAPAKDSLIAFNKWLTIDSSNGIIYIPDNAKGLPGEAKPEKIRFELLAQTQEASVSSDSKEYTDLKFSKSGKDEGSFLLNGFMPTPYPGKRLKVTQELSADAQKNSAVVKFKISPDGEALKFKNLSLNIMMNNPFQGRLLSLNSTLVTIPEKLANPCLFYTKADEKIGKIEIPLMQGKLLIEGTPVKVLFCQYPNGHASLRLHFIDENSSLEHDAEISLKLTYTPYSFSPVSLKSSANMSFKDEERDDNKGGWTDQGSNNDISSMITGRHIFGNASFEIINPADNSDKSCIVLGNPARKFLPRNAEVQLPQEKAAYLYLLHASAWTPKTVGESCGTLKISYKDGSTQDFDVQAMRDLGDWWEPGGYTNAAVAWRGSNPSAESIGLYLSRFKLENKDLASLKIESAGKAVWMIAGISLCQDLSIPQIPVTSDVETVYETKADKDWKTYTFSKDTLKGSALDFSFLKDAPAGKYGRVIIKNGKFVFEGQPDKTVRFFGANLNRDAVTGLSKEEAEIIADRLAATGYNAVRFHHFDGSLIVKGAKSPELDPARLDAMDYLIYCLKERGIYVVIDVYISRIEGFKEDFKEHTEVKIAAAFDKETMDNIILYAERLLTHVNPYTGNKFKDEPSLVAVSLINENPLITNFFVDTVNRTPYLKKAVDASFKSWCESRNVPFPERINSNQSLLIKFLTEKQIESYKTLGDALRKFGVRQPFSDMSCGSFVSQTIPRDAYDFVDIHYYHDHPEYTGKAFASSSMIHNKNAIVMPEARNFYAIRIFGKPCTVTEWNFCYPNKFRSEGGAIMGAYASLQDLDGIYLFEYASHDGGSKTAFKDVHTWAFNTVCDPMRMLAERMNAIFFLRGDVKKAESKIAYAVSPDVINLPSAKEGLYWEGRESAGFPALIKQLGTYCQVASVLVDPLKGKIPAQAALTNEKLPDSIGGVPIYQGQNNWLASLEKQGIVKSKYFKPEEKYFKSETNEIEADGKNGNFKVVTEKSECLSQSGAEQTGSVLSVKNNSVFSTVFATSVDGKKLEDSSRILILHLTDLRNTGEKCRIYKGKVIWERGTGKYPLLIRRGSVEISLKNSSESNELWALDVTGKRLFQVPFKKENGHLSFTANIDSGDAGVMAYELVGKMK